MRPSRSKPEVDHDACGVGFIAQLGSSGSRDVVERALTALERLCHRGGVDADGLSGDGAGILTPIPKDFIRKRAREVKSNCPSRLAWAWRLSAGPGIAGSCDCRILRDRAGIALSWLARGAHRSVAARPLRAHYMPLIRQCFFITDDPAADLERQLFLMRKRVESGSSPASISAHSRRSRSCTRDCSRRCNSAPSIRTSPTRISSRRSLFFTSATPPTPAVLEARAAFPVCRA